MTHLGRIAITDFAGRGLGVAAVERIPAGTCVLREAPISAIMGSINEGLPLSFRLLWSFTLIRGVAQVCPRADNPPGCSHLVIAKPA